MPTRTQSAPKQNALHEALSAMVQTLPRGGRLPTVLELCSRLGTTKVTLGRVLDRLERERLVSRRRGSGLYAGPAIGAKQVGLVFGGDIFSPEYSPFWLLMMQAAAQAAGETDMRLRTYLDVGHSDKEWALHHELQEDLRAHRLDGVVVCGLPLAAARELSLHGIPIVGAGPQRGRIDHEALIADGVRLLAGAGCRRLALLSKSTPEEEAPFIRHVMDHGLVADLHRLWTYDRCIRTLPPGLKTMEDYGEAVVRANWRPKDRSRLEPDGILSLDDTSTRGAVRALGELGVVVGRDVRVASTAVRGSPILEGIKDHLLLLETDPLDLMRVNFALLAQYFQTGRMAHEPAPIRSRLVGKTA